MNEKPQLSKTGSVLGIGYGSDDDSDGPPSKAGNRRRKRKEDSLSSDSSKDGTVKPSKKKPPLNRIGSILLSDSYASDDEEESDNENGGSQVKLNGAASGAVEITTDFGGGDEMVSALVFNEGDPVLPSHHLPLIRAHHPATEDFRDMKLLPPDPTTKANPAVQKKIADFMAKVKTMNLSFNESLLNQKDFHNPYILDKIARMYDIDQRGSNYPRSLYNPLEITRDDMYEVIAGQQKFEEDRRAEERKKRTTIDFVPRPPTPSRPTTPHQNPGGTGISLEPVTDQIAAAKLKVKAVQATTAAAVAKATAAVIVQEIKDKERKGQKID